MTQIRMEAEINIDDQLVPLSCCLLSFCMQVMIGALRVLFGGLLAMGITYAVGYGFSHYGV